MNSYHQADYLALILPRGTIVMIPSSINLFAISPSNIELADFEMRLVSVINREQVLSSCLEPLRNRYDYILIDCPPSLGMLTVNALSAADQGITGKRCRNCHERFDFGSSRSHEDQYGGCTDFPVP